MSLDLEAPRLRLAPFRTDEAGLLHQLWMDPGVRRYLWDDQVIPPEQTAEILTKNEELFRRHACLKPPARGPHGRRPHHRSCHARIEVGCGHGGAILRNPGRDGVRAGGLRRHR